MRMSLIIATLVAGVFGTAAVHADDSEERRNETEAVSDSDSGSDAGTYIPWTWEDVDD